MTTILCNQCEKYKIEIEEKNKEIAILKNNSLDLKSRLFETSNLISAYIQMKTQFDSLIKENDLLKQKKDDNNDKYKFEVLKQKILQKSERIRGLESEVKQLNDKIEVYKRETQDNLMNTKENKLKRELSEKDKYINNQNLIIERLRSEKNLLNISNNNYSNNNEGVGMEEDNLYSNKNQIKISELVKEKEYLDDEYRKYRAKYIKYKYKYKEFKNNAKFFMKYYSPSNMTIKKDVELLKRKRDRLASEYMEEEIDKRNTTNNQNHKISFDYGNNNASDIFENKLEDEMDLEINNTFNDNNEENKEIVVKEIANDNQNNKKEKRKQEKDNKEIVISKIQTRAMEKAEKMKQVITPQKESEKETKKKKEKKEKKEKKIKKEKDNKTKEEEEKITSKEKESKQNIEIKDVQNKIEENTIKRQTVPHINPIKKQKVIPESKIELNSYSLVEYLSAISITEIKEESLSSLFQSLKTLTEKITCILEGIISNISKLDLSKVIVFIKIFIKMYGHQTPSSLSIISNNFLEFINLHEKTIIQSKQKFIIKETNPYYSNEIIKENNTSLHLITFIIDILYNELNDVSILSKFLFNFLLNKLTNSFVKDDTLKEITKLISKSYKSNQKKVFLNDNEFKLFFVESNANSFYFLSLFKTRLISENIFNLLISIFNDISSKEIDTLLSSQLLESLNKIPKDTLLSIENKEKLSLNKNIIYLEIFQIITLSCCIRDSDWNNQNLFSKVLWEQFTKTEDFSLKRSMIIYYTSLICYFSIKNGAKTTELCWLYSIYKPDDNTGRFSFYDKICALSWIVDSSFITMVQKFFNVVKSSVEGLPKEYLIDCSPSDFLHILKKNKII